MRLIQSISKGISLQKRKRITLEKINLLTLFSLIYLVVSTINLLPTRVRLAKKTRTIKEVFGTVGYKDRVAAITPL